MMITCVHNTCALSQLLNEFVQSVSFPAKDSSSGSVSSSSDSDSSSSSSSDTDSSGPLYTLRARRSQPLKQKFENYDELIDDAIRVRPLECILVEDGSNSLRRETCRIKSINNVKLTFCNECIVVINNLQLYLKCGVQKSLSKVKP